MRVNSVTWYSKLLAMILFITLPFFGFYLGMKYQEATTINENTATNNNLDSAIVLKEIKTDELTINVVYKDGKVRYSGTVRLPSPCYEIKDETTIQESFPEKVQILIKTEIPNASTRFCAQIITSKEFSGEIRASEQAEVSIWLNNKKVK